MWEHPDGARERIGYHDVINATPVGRGLFPERLTAYQWHREGFDLPHGAELLATGGDAFHNQAFEIISLRQERLRRAVSPGNDSANDGALGHLGKGC